MNADRSRQASRSQEEVDGSTSDRPPVARRITPGEHAGVPGAGVRSGNGSGLTRVTPRSTDPVWEPRSN